MMKMLTRIKDGCLLLYSANLSRKKCRGEMMTISSARDVTSGTKSRHPVSAKVKQIRKLPSFRLGMEAVMLLMPKDLLKSKEKKGEIIM